MTRNTRILVVGATGCIGSRLTTALTKYGHEVTAFSRSVSQTSFPYGVETFEGDLREPDSISDLCTDIDVAYYLVHSLGGENFAEQDRKCARRFREEATANSVDRVVYLSGISPDTTELSPHLASRRDVESVLAAGAYDLTVLRAAIVIGPDSASFRIIDDLTDRTPFLVVPTGVRTPCQPIYVHDVVTYLVELLDVGESRGKTYDIGGLSIVTYESLLKLTAREKDKRIFIVSVPGLTPEQASHGLRLMTDVPYTITRSLVESIQHPVTVNCDRDLQNVIPIERTPIANAIRRVLGTSETSHVASITH